MKDIHPFDILSGKVVKNQHGTFWFKDAGNNVGADGYPKFQRLHRDNSLPAAIWANGNQYWYKDGLLHGENDLPAVTHFTGLKEWYKDGKRHRDNDLPAIIYEDGFQEWYKDGKRYNQRKVNERYTPT